MVEEWFRAALAAAAGVKAWPLQAGEYQMPPFIVYERQSTERERHLAGPSGLALATFNVAIFSEAYADARRLARLVCDHTANFKAETPGVTILDAWLEDESDGETIESPGDEKPWFQVSQTWLVRYSEE